MSDQSHDRGLWSQAYRAMREESRPKPARTVKVRIAVAVNDNGYWYAIGQESQLDGYMEQRASEGMGRPSGLVVHWITAELPIPETAEVEGVVDDEVMKLRREIEALRRFGNKDCTAMADDYLERSDA